MWIRALCLLLGVACGIAISSVAQDPTEQPNGCQQLANACYDQLVAEVKNRGWLGVELSHSESRPGHLLVNRVHAQGPGERAGIKKDDLIVGLKGVSFSKANNYDAARQLIKSTLAGVRPGVPISCTVLRGAGKIELELTPAPYQREALAEYIGFKVMAASR